MTKKVKIGIAVFIGLGIIGTLTEDPPTKEESTEEPSKFTNENKVKAVIRALFPPLSPKDVEVKLYCNIY